MNTIKMKSVSELVRAAGNSSVERYKISSYQRGYRWKAEEQVRALLDDLKDFSNSQKAKSIAFSPSLWQKEKMKRRILGSHRRTTTTHHPIFALARAERRSL